jgi:filamentous hemagglutinin family protein
MQTNKWLLSLSVAVMATNVYALPEVSPTAAPDGANIHPAAHNATHMHIEQTAPNAVVNWHSFNVGTNESVHFQQPSATSIILNRVDPRQGVSTIAGQISANGRVIISNGAGIHFTPTSRVDVAGLIATTANITNENFKKGKYIFEDKSNLDGKVINEGIISINAKEHGFAALIAPSVANKGVITASLGKIAMYSTDKFVMNFSGNNLIHFEVPDKVVRDVVMQGDVIANVVTFNHTHANEVLDHVVHVPANSIARSVSQRNGVIILSAEPNADLHLSENQGRVTVAPRRAAIPEQQVVRNNMSSAYLFANYLDRPMAPYADDGRLSRESGYFVVEDEKPAQPAPARTGLLAQYLELERHNWNTEAIALDANMAADLPDAAPVALDDGFEMIEHADYPVLTEERLAQHNLASSREQKWDSESIISGGYVSINSNDDIDSLSPSELVANRMLEQLDRDIQSNEYKLSDQPWTVPVSNRSESSGDSDWELLSSPSSSASVFSIISSPSISAPEIVQPSPHSSDWEVISRSSSASDISSISGSSISSDVSAPEIVQLSPISSDWDVVSRSSSASDISSVSGSSFGSSWSSVSDASSLSSSISSVSSASEEKHTMHLAFRFNSAGSSVIVPNDVESDLHLAFRFDPNLGRDIVPINNEPNLRFSFRFNDEARVVQQPAAVMDANGIIRVQPPGGIAVPNDLALELGHRVVNNNPQDLHLNFRFADSVKPIQVQPPVDEPRIAEPDAEPNPVPVMPLQFRFANDPAPVDSHYVFRFDPVNNAPVVEAPNAKNAINSPLAEKPQAPQVTNGATLTANINTPNKVFIQCGAMKYVNTAQGWELRCDEDFDLKPLQDVKDLITYPAEKPDEPQLDIEV